MTAYKAKIWTGSQWDDIAQSYPAGTIYGPNLVHNGAMRVWQRGTPLTDTSAASSYGPDRWHVYSGTTGRTVSRQTGPTGFQYAVRFQRDSGNANTNYNYLGQNFETTNSIPLAGQTVTLSFWARVGANYSATSSLLGAQVRSGTGTDENFIAGLTGNSNFISQTPTVTTSWARYSYTGTVPSNATQLAVVFYHVPTGTASTNDWFEVAGVQLEIGSTATSYEFKDYADDLRTCQRYYYALQYLFDSGISPAYYTSTTSLETIIRFPVTMRQAPGLECATGTDYYLAIGTAIDYLNSLSIYQATPDSAQLYNNTQVSGTAGQACHLRYRNAGARIAFSADL